MKQLLLLSCLLPALCFAGGRDMCKKIRKTTDPATGSLTSKSPDLKYITVIKQYRKDTFFALLLHFGDRSQHFESKGASIEFADGTVITDDAVKVNCTQELSLLVGGSSSAATGGKYLLQGFFRITNETAANFMLKRIVKVSLHTASQQVSPGEADKVMNYVRCLK